MMNVLGWVFLTPTVYRFGGKVMRLMVPLFPKAMLNSSLNPWTTNRAMPVMPKKSFAELLKSRESKDE